MSSPPPRLTSLPLDPSRAFELDAGGIVEHLEQSARRVEKMLRAGDPFLGVDADADARRVRHLQGLAPRLRALGAELQASRGPKPLPLAEASLATRVLATRLFLASEQLDSIVSEWTRCDPRHSSVALAGLEGISLGLETADEHAHTASLYLFFEGHPPGVVPREGGWLVVAGTGLERESGTVLDLRLRGSGRSVAMRPAHPLGAEALAVWVATDILTQHAGECLSLVVRRDPRPGLRDALRTADIFEATLPFCVPQSASSAYELAARLEYRSAFRSKVVEPKNLLFVNDSCREETDVSGHLAWDLEEGSTLIDLNDEVLFESNSPMVECALEGTGIRCAGTLPPSICESRADGDARLVRITEWEHWFTPTVRIPEEEDHLSQALSPLVDTQLENPICIDLVREAASEVSSMRFRLIAANAHQRRVFFESPMETLRTSREATYDLPSHRIEAEFQAGDATNPARVCVVLHSDACAF